VYAIHHTILVITISCKSQPEYPQGWVINTPLGQFEVEKAIKKVLTSPLKVNPVKKIPISKSPLKLGLTRNR